MGDKFGGAALADIVSSSLNTFGFSEDIENFVKHMSREHRTLQQTFTRLCVAWLQHLATVNSCDGRNEASVEFARSIKEELDKAALPFI